MVVKPDSFHAVDHFVSLVCETFKFDVGVVNVGIQQVVMKISDGPDVPAVFGATGNLNPYTFPDPVSVPGGDGIHMEYSI